MLLEFTQMIPSFENVSNFTQVSMKLFQFVQIWFKAVSILPSEANLFCH